MLKIAFIGYISIIMQGEVPHNPTIEMSIVMTNMTAIPILGERESGKTTVGRMIAEGLAEQTLLPPGQHECSTIFIEIVHRALQFRPTSVDDLEYLLMLGVKWSARLTDLPLHRGKDFDAFLDDPRFEKERGDLRAWFERICVLEPEFRFTPQNKIDNVSPLIWLAKLGRTWANNKAVFMANILADLDYEAGAGLSHALVSGTRMPEEVTAMWEVADWVRVILVERAGLATDTNPSNARRGLIQPDTTIVNSGLTLGDLEVLIKLHLIPDLLNDNLQSQYNTSFLA